MIMWIILGVLIGVVAIFLVVTGFMDRKKNKRLKAKAKELDNLRKNAQNLVIVWVNEVIMQNQKALDNFVPSIGKVKMKDIIWAAKKSLNLLTKKEIYKLALDSQENPQVIHKFKELFDSHANNWPKRNHETVEYFQTKASEILQEEKNYEFAREAKILIKGVYDEFTK